MRNVQHSTLNDQHSGRDDSDLSIERWMLSVECCGRKRSGIPEASISARAQHAASRAASVLVLTLWTLFFLGALAVAIGSTVSMNLRVAERLRADALGWTLAKAGIDRAMAETAKDTNAWDALSEPWADNEPVFKNASLGPGHFRVYWEDRSELQSPRIRYGVRDEDGKVNLRLASTNLVAALFAVAGGISESAAASMAGAVANYRARPPSVLTGLAVTPYAARDKPPSQRFQSIYEVLLVEGMTAELFARLGPFITVFGDEQGAGQVNLNTADPIVLRSVARACGVPEPETLVGLIMDFRRAGKALIPGTRGMVELWRQLSEFDPQRSLLQGAFLSLGRGNMVTVRSACFGGVAEGWMRGETGAVARIAFVFTRKNGIMRFWREE